MNLSCFKAYDVRGRIPDELNADLAYQIGRAYAGFVKPRRVAVGRDIRLSSTELAGALMRGLMDSGVDVMDIGLGGTECAYFATFSQRYDGGIMVTASHNPPDYNGMKFVREEARPISADTGLQEMAAMIRDGRLPPPAARLGRRQPVDLSNAYVEHLLGYVDRTRLHKLKVVVNAGNGGAGLIVDQLEPYLPFEFVKIHHEPDGSFPNGVPNPMLEENRRPTIDSIRRHRADVGLAWDGDYDRCFFFDETGAFIEGYYIVGLLAESFLEKEPGARIVYDPRLTWNTIDIVRRLGGEPVLCKSGHAFIKQKMREVDAAYGGEMSAHHYFRRFAYCDSGMIPWLLVLERMCISGKPLSALVGARMQAFPASGEINRKLADAKAALAAVRARYEPQAVAIDLTDGLSMEFDRWRFNLRSSNTEPLVRLNVEARGDAALMRDKTAELLALLDRAQ
ncbi:MAG: phosphomannomutase [Steroidobacteraceae bacterium]|nr:phosphomannomutase [Steroidobacteraceae bacterium]MDW8257963.1 phosphomannomutase [Gammaproteobacteria bacterium]